MGHVDSDRLVELALPGGGRPTPGELTHLTDCPTCVREAAGLRAVVDTVRGPESAATPVLTPPPRVWAAVQAELGHVPPASVHRPRRRMRLAAAALVLVLASAGAGWAVVGRDSPGGGTVAQAQLRPLAAAAEGSARWVRTADGAAVDVQVTATAPVGHYLEVWLLDPGTAHMVALGSVPADGSVVLPVPPGVAVGDYSDVDISIEPLDGDAAHSGVSAARGALVPVG